MPTLTEILENLNRKQALQGENGRSPYEIHSSVLPVVKAGSAAIPLLWDRLAMRTPQSDPLLVELSLVLLGLIRDPQVDRLLLQLLHQADLRPKALYLLGCINGKGWPYRERNEDRLLRRIYPFCFENTTYLDPWYNQTFYVSDFALGAFIRIAGKAHFPIVDYWRSRGDWPHAEFIGLALPDWDEPTRQRLQREAKAFWTSKHEGKSLHAG